MARANFLGVPALILHPGAHTGAGEAAGIASIASALHRALDRVPPPVSILIENTAGMGSSIGHAFEKDETPAEDIMNLATLRGLFRQDPAA